MGNSKMDSSAVYTLFEELKQKIDKLDKGAKHNKNSQPGSSENLDEVISLIEGLKVQINQQRFSPEQIKNLGQISAYSINKGNENFNKAFAELKAAIKPIDEKINQIKSQQNLVIRNQVSFTLLTDTNVTIRFRHRLFAFTRLHSCFNLFSSTIPTFRDQVPVFPYRSPPREFPPNAA